MKNPEPLPTPDASQSKSVEREEIARLRLFAEGISADGNREDDVDDVMCRIYHLLGFEDGLRADILALIGSTPQTPAPAPRGEEGWVLVPREPTADMQFDAGKVKLHTLLYPRKGDGTADLNASPSVDMDQAASIYRAMLAAAPKAPGP